MSKVSLLHAIYQTLGERTLDVVSRAPYPIRRGVLKGFSEISRICLDGEGQPDETWKQLEYIYRNAPPNTPWHLLDHAILNREGCIGARSRLETVKARITSLIGQYRSKQDRVDIVDVGTGPGWYINEVIRGIGDGNVYATCIDQSEEAIRYATEQAQRFGIDGHVRFIPQPYSEFAHTQGEYDIALLIGVLDYLQPSIGIRMLRSIRDKLKPGGTLLTSNMREHNLKWAMDTVGWRLIYKTPEDVKRILERLGLTAINIGCEPTGIFIIGEGKKP